MSRQYQSRRQRSEEGERRRKDGKRTLSEHPPNDSRVPNRTLHPHTPNHPLLAREQPLQGVRQQSLRNASLAVATSLAAHSPNPRIPSRQRPRHDRQLRVPLLTELSDRAGVPLCGGETQREVHRQRQAGSKGAKDARQRVGTEEGGFGLGRAEERRGAVCELEEAEEGEVQGGRGGRDGGGKRRGSLREVAFLGRVFPVERLLRCRVPLLSVGSGLDGSEVGEDDVLRVELRRSLDESQEAHHDWEVLELLDDDGKASAGLGFVEEGGGKVVGRGRGGETAGETVLLLAVPLGVEGESEWSGEEGGDAVRQG